MKKVVIIVYIFFGLGGGLGGVFLIVYFGFVCVDMGSEIILLIIIVVVLGGIFIMGGKGSIIGIVLVSIFIGFM